MPTSSIRYAAAAALLMATAPGSTSPEREAFKETIAFFNAHWGK